MGDRWSRRDFLATGSALLAAGCSDTSRPVPDEDAPNILLITLDDLGWKTLPRYGNPNIETPTIDRIADAGAVFTRAFNASSSCSSSRASIVTGSHLSHHGVNGLVHRHPGANLSPSVVTLADRLWAGGYHTAHYGKWHVSEESPRHFGYAENLNPNGTNNEPIETAEEILAFLERRGERHFYLELNFLATHLRPDGTFPNDPQFHVDPDEVELLPVWTMPNWEPVVAMAAAYFSQVRRVDAILGEVVERLEALGVADRTLIVITSDNGAPFPGNKHTLFDRGIGTPLIVSWPDGFVGGQVHDGLRSNVDLAPTLTEAAKVAPMPQADGRSFLDLLQGRPHSHDDAIFAAIDFHDDYTPLRALRDDRYKLILSYGDTPIGLGQLDDAVWAQRLAELPNQPWTLPLPPVSLYDLEADPNEQSNLVFEPDYEDVLHDLHARLQSRLESLDDAMAGVLLPPFV